MSKNKFKDYDQGDFYSAYLYSFMPKNKYLENVDKIVDFAIFNKIFDHLYSNIGQKAFSPSMQVKIIFLQTNYSLSDRQLEERLNFDLSWKRFVGFPAGYFGYDHSTLGLFRDRIGAEGYKAIHNYILAQIVDRGLIDAGEPWLNDATHSLSRLANHSAIQLAQQAIGQLEILLRRICPAGHLEFTKQFNVAELLKEKPVYREGKGSKCARLQLVVTTGYAVLNWVEHKAVKDKLGLPDDKWRQVEEKARVLKEILEQNFTIDDNSSGSPGDKSTSNTPESEITTDSEAGEAKGNRIKITRYREKTKDEKPGDRIVSAVDKDARRGAKSAKKFFLGPKSEITLTGKSHLILNAKAIAGNEPDGGHIFEMVDEVKEIHGIEPPKIIGDGKYGSMDTRIEGKERGIQVVAPLADTINPTGGYTADKFKYDPLLSIVVCPAGRLTSMNHRNESAGATIYHFSATFCSNCPQKKYCTRSDRGRTITIEDTWAVADDARRYLGTPEAKQDMRIRSQLERVNNELKNNLGLKVCRFYGLTKHQIQLHATSFVYNIRQTVRLIMRENSKRVAPNNIVQ